MKQENFWQKQISTVKNRFNNHFAGKTKFNIFLDIVTFVLFALSIFSIPVCSFSSILNIVTWVLTIGFIGCMLLSCLLYYGWYFDGVLIAFILFSISCLISTALNGFVAFRITPIAMSLLGGVIYLYCKVRGCGPRFLKGALYGIILFLGVFVIRYFPALIRFSFERLGDLFGDINDISLFLSLGLVLSTYYAIYVRKVIWTIVYAILALMFLYCGFATGSKIFIILVLATFIAIVFMVCGKKKWWLALIIVVVSFIAGFLLLNYVPFLSSIKVRFYAFINQIFGTHIGNVSYKDYSTMDRVTMFKNGIVMFFQKPMFGWGIWGYGAFNGLTNSWSHNNISESLCNFGIIGTIFFHAGFYAGIRGYVVRKDKKMNIMLLVIIFFMVSMLSVALNGEKIYAYIAPIAFATLSTKQRSKYAYQEESLSGETFNI